MSGPARMVVMAGALLGLSAVVLAAFGSHAVDFRGSAELQRIWQMASTLHLVHAAAVVGLGALLASLTTRWLQVAAWLMISGTIVFSGSLYVRVISGAVVKGLTPSGGLLLMAGWLLLLLALLRKP